MIPPVTELSLPMIAFLHGVRKREQNHEIERVKLRQLALAEEAQQHHQRQIHDGGTKQLFQQGKLHLEHVVEDRGVGHGKRIAPRSQLCRSIAALASRASGFAVLA